jgi:lysophospholipase L1-like esterase
MKSLKRQLSIHLILLGISFSANGQENSRESIRIAALGDSITTGFNADGVLDQRHLSWSTGGDLRRRVKSHVFWIKEFYPGIQIKAMNLARAGATMVELRQQAEHLIKNGGADYITILMGANDLCGMTQENFLQRLETARQDIEAAISMLLQSNSATKVLVSAIPNMLRLYEIGKERGCQSTWQTLGICPNLLGADRTPDDRWAFHEHWLAFNNMLQESTDRFSDSVVFSDDVIDVLFERSSISWIDCFHPSILGQNVISEVTWNQGFFRN